MTRRTLGEMLAEVGAGALASAATPGLRITHVAIALPVEVALVRQGGAWVLQADLPRAVTRTVFDLEPARLAVTWMPREEPA